MKKVIGYCIIKNINRINKMRIPLYVMIFIGLIIFLLTIVNMMISFHLSEKYKLIEQFEVNNKELNKKLEGKINNQKGSINLLKYAMKEIVDIIQRVPNSIVNDFKNQDANDDADLIKPYEMEIISKEQKVKKIDISKLSKEERKLGESLIHLEFGNKEEELKKAMKKINLEPTDDVLKNYCLYRSAIGLCKLGRNDCKDYCKQDNRGIIWG